MKVLGLVGSGRPRGNGEVLVKAALDAARGEGASVELLRLTDFRVLPCDGCMACVFREPGAGDLLNLRGLCPVEDDAWFVFGKLLECDGLVVSAPTYLLSPAAQVKGVVDRSLMLHRYFFQRESRWGLRPAAGIACAGIRGWDPLARPLLNQLALCLGFYLVGSVTAFAPGPAQSLVDPRNEEAARELGRRVALGERGDPPAGKCPVCHGEAFTLVSQEEVECPLCLVRGRLEPAAGGGVPRITFDPGWTDSHRWTREHMRHHLEEWVLKTRELYLRDRPVIKEARRRLDELEIPWVTGPGVPEGTARS